MNPTPTHWPIRVILLWMFLADLALWWRARLDACGANREFAALCKACLHGRDDALAADGRGQPPKARLPRCKKKRMKKCFPVAGPFRA